MPIRQGLTAGACLLLCLGCLGFELPAALRPPPPPEPELVLLEAPPAALPAPEGLRATSGEYRTIPLKWDPLLNEDIGGYLIEHAPALDGPFRRLVTVRGRGVLSYVDRGTPAEDEAESGLLDGETRFYRLRAFAPSGHLAAEASAVVVGTTAPLPDPPRRVRAYSRQPREVPLSWTASRDPIVAGYTVERSPTSEGPFETVAEVEGRFTTTYLDAPLGDLRVFYYRVSARNPGGALGEPSTPTRAVTKPEPLPPLGLRVTERRLGANVLEWEPNVETDLVEYRLYRLREAGQRTLVAAVTASATRAEDAEVGAGEILAYEIVAVDRDGLESHPSGWETVVSEDYDLSVSTGPEGVRIAWRPRSQEGYDRARLDRTAWLTARRSAKVEAGGFLDADVSPGKRYRYTVTLLRPDGTEAPPSRGVEVLVPELDAVR